MTASVYPLSCGSGLLPESPGVAPGAPGSSPGAQQSPQPPRPQSSEATNSPRDPGGRRRPLSRPPGGPGPGRRLHPALQQNQGGSWESLRCSPACRAARNLPEASPCPAPKALSTGWSWLPPGDTAAPCPAPDVPLSRPNTSSSTAFSRAPPWSPPSPAATQEPSHSPGQVQAPR